MTPSIASFGCQGSFDITITNTGAPGTTLVISSLTLAYLGSGTGFSWDLSQVTLPASLASGVTLTIPVVFSAVGQSSPSQLQLGCDSNADNAHHLVLDYFGGTEAACWAPTSTPTPTATYCPTGTPCPTGSVQVCGRDHPSFPPENVCGCVCALETPTASPTGTPTPVPTGDLGYRNVGGVVYDASKGPTAPIAGAAVTYTQLSFLHPGSGLATTGSDGHYAFQLYLHDTDSITFKAGAAGFHAGSTTFGGLDLWSSLEPIDLALAPEGTATPTETSTAAPTPTPTCAPTATPYCSDNCVPCPTIRPGCYASACGACIQNPTCASDAACVPSYDPYINGCCSCATVTPTPTPTPTVLVYCTPPPCREWEVFYCSGECPGGCGTECATPTPTPTVTDTPTPTPTPTVTDTPTPCPTGTPPSCPVGQFVSCDPNPCNGCHCEPCTPCPPGEVFTGCPGLVCPCACAPAQGSVAAGFSVGLPNGTVDVPIALLLEPDVELATLEFTLTVSSDGFEPLLSPLSFQPAAALPTPNVITSAGNDTVRLRWLTGFVPPLGGGLDLGILNVPLPYSQGWGSYGLYTVNVVDVSATSADGSPLPLRGLGATITRCSMIFFGLVTDAATGDGIQGASVCFDSSSACVQTDPNGVYQGLCYTSQSSHGTYMCAVADGYEGRCQGPWTPMGISLEIDFALAAVTVPTPTPTDTPTATPGPEISITPSGLSLDCQGSFDITITNTGAPETTLEITSLTLAHGYSQGYYGTGFSWDLSQITLPASLPSGATLTIPVTFNAADQTYPSRLELSCDSNAANAPHLFVVYFGGSQAACFVPTSTPTTPPIDHGPTPSFTPTSTPTPHWTATETPPANPTATFYPTGTPYPTDSTATPAPTATATASPCTGDCGNDGTVTVDEILTMVNIALGTADVSTCAPGDANGDGQITVDEILTAVNNALSGCG